MFSSLTNEKVGNCTSEIPGIKSPKLLSPLVSSQPHNVVKYIMYVLHNQSKGIKHEEIHRDAY